MKSVEKTGNLYVTNVYRSFELRTLDLGGDVYCTIAANADRSHILTTYSSELDDLTSVEKMQQMIDGELI